jgi:hypothetical protein
MKKALLILPILIFLVGCSAEKKLGMTDNKLVEGTFYLNKKLSNDTLRFQLEKFDKGGWNNKVWRITEDTIFQEDSRGLSYYFGKDRCKYQLKNDTLFIWTNIRNDNVEVAKKTQNNVEKYFVLKSNKKQLELIDLNKNKLLDTTNEIRSDIQLR